MEKFKIEKLTSKKEDFRRKFRYALISTCRHHINKQSLIFFTI